MRKGDGGLAAVANLTGGADGECTERLGGVLRVIDSSSALFRERLLYISEILATRVFESALERAREYTAFTPEAPKASSTACTPRSHAESLRSSSTS